MAERLLSEYVSVIAAIDPSNNATSLGSDVWDMENFEKVMAVVSAGAFGTAGTVDAKFLESATSNGTYTTHVASKSITQLTEAGSDDNKQAIINMNAAEVAATTMRWAKLKLTCGGTTNYISAIVLGWPRRTLAFTTIAAHDVSSVDEIVG